jgi:hypothetical protein
MENKKPTGTVMIPFLCTIHNKISRFLKKHITAVHIPERKTAQMQRFAKDELELMVLGIYIRFCASAEKCMSDTVEGLVRQGAQNTT